MADTDTDTDTTASGKGTIVHDVVVRLDGKTVATAKAADYNPTTNPGTLVLMEPDVDGTLEKGKPYMAGWGDEPLEVPVTYDKTLPGAAWFFLDRR